MHAAPFIRMIDKLSFLVGVGSLLATEYIMLRDPSWMPYFFTACVIPLLILRFWTYHRQKFHYFMLDFCYFCNALLLFYIFFYPNSALLFQLLFCLCNGPLLWGIYMWHNSLVFHDLDKMTSVAIHILPPLVTWCLRWYPSSEFVVCSSAECTFTARQAWRLCFYFYAFWQLAYVVKTEVIDKARFERDEQLMTSARWMTRKKPHPIYQFVSRNRTRVPFGQFLTDYPFVILIAVQVAYTVLTIMPSAVLYHSFEIHTALLLAMFLISTWNGANFYFDVFARNYAKRLEQQISAANLAQQQQDKQDEQDKKQQQQQQS